MSEAYDAYNAKPVVAPKPAKKKAEKALAEPTVSISVAGRAPTPPVPLSVLSEALNTIKDGAQASKRKSAPMREEGTAVGSVAAHDLFPTAWSVQYLRRADLGLSVDCVAADLVDRAGVF